jgi:hypothetical protein
MNLHGEIGPITPDRAWRRVTKRKQALAIDQQSVGRSPLQKLNHEGERRFMGLVAGVRSFGRLAVTDIVEGRLGAAQLGIPDTR